jgi:hypothetical protein
MIVIKDVENEARLRSLHEVLLQIQETVIGRRIA